MWNEDSKISYDTSLNFSINNSNLENKPNLKRGQNCVPVMIAHLNRHRDNLSIWGMVPNIITLVAKVCKIEAISAKIVFEFQDETGSIKGVKWLESNNESYKSPVDINSYARIHGMLRNQNDNFVLVMNIQPMENLNELLTHLMEVTLLTLEGEKTMNTVVQSDYSLVNNIMNTSNNIDSLNAQSGLNREQVLILNIIQHSDPEYGAERNEIKSKVPSHLISKVDEILEFLSGEGHIYTTKTDDYFKVI